VTVEASELRPGDMLDMNGKILEIVSREHKRTGARGQALIQVDLSIPTG
jgi:translation elongation factor P/translation initiation factor 5A